MLFLIGLPACGKSTLMHALAAAVPGLRALDLDDAIVARAGKSIPDIFDTDGEDAFRRIEADELRRSAGCGYDIIACGGGTPCRPGNMEYMQSMGTVVHLVADPDRIVNRLLDAPGKRPMAEPHQGNPAAMRRFIDELAARRAPHYGRATATFDTTHLDTPAEVATTTATFITTYLK